MHFLTSSKNKLFSILPKVEKLAVEVDVKKHHGYSTCGGGQGTLFVLDVHSLNTSLWYFVSNYFYMTLYNFG